MSMSNNRPRGLIFFVLIGLVAVIAGAGFWRMSKPGGGAGAGRVASAPPPGRPGLVKGTGTSWGEEPAPAGATAAIEGVVLDPDGRPVDGAQVALSRVAARGEEVTPGSYFQPRGATATAGGGRFRIEGLIPGEYTAAALHDAWAPARRGRITALAAQTTRTELKLGRGGLVLRGRVVDVGGGVVSGARVTAVPHASRSGGGGPALLRVTSGADGLYKVTLARGSHSLRIEAEGYAPGSDEVFMARATTKDLRLVPGARLTGRVVERGGKQPVAGASVSLTSASRQDFRVPRDTKSDGAGQFELGGLEPGSYEVMARRGTLIGAGKVVALAVAQSLDDVIVEVDRGYVVSGRVKDEGGAGLGNVRVSASRTGPPYGQAARTRTNPDGSYALEGMLPGEYRVGVNEEGRGLSMTRARVLAADVTGVDLVVPPASKISGRVLSPEGRPVEGATVQATFDVTMGGGGTLTSGEGTGTGPDGSFQLKRIPAGSLRVSARHEDYGAASVGPQPVKAGEVKTLTLTLKKGATITGTVKTDEGRPAADVRVSALLRGPSMMSDSAEDITGPDGRYRLTGLSGGRVTVAAHRGSRPSWGASETPDHKFVTLAEGEERVVDLVVGPPGTAIQGTVLSADGKPVPGATVMAAPEQDGRAFRGNARETRAYTNMDGAFAIENLNKAPYTVWASHPEHPDAESKGVLGGSKGVKVQFPRETSVAGVVVDAQGKPVPHYTLVILPGPRPSERPEDRRRRQMNAFDAPTLRVQDPGGAFEVKRLAVGTHELAVSTAAGESATHVVDVAAGQRLTGVRIQVQPGLRITGRVVEYGTDRPVPGATVSVLAAGGARSEGEVAPDGSFALTGAPSGDTIRLMAGADPNRYVSENKELEIKPGQTTVDAGAIRLLPGNMRERMMVDMSERGQTGAAVTQDRGHAVVRSVQAEGPAARAGLAKGDLVVSIDGQNARDLGNGALGYLLTGKPGTDVTLVVESPAGGAPRTLKITREAYKPPTARTN
jgi:protocatechuate 3,4-dioxygenase beta subunit